MPRIDPHKLLTCLSVLLAPNGGIRSSNDVKRLAGLMAKFSKKLVSKCIYIQILKCTETDLLCQFMSAGGWSLVHMWLTDGILTKNLPLVQEILELLLLCPVDVARLKSNSAPKLVKGLSKDGGNEAVRILATKLVEQWLKFVKSETLAEQSLNISVPSSLKSINSVTNTDESGKIDSSDMGIEQSDIMGSEENIIVTATAATVTTIGSLTLTSTATTTAANAVRNTSPMAPGKTIVSPNAIYIDTQISDSVTDNEILVDPLATPERNEENVADPIDVSNVNEVIIQTKSQATSKVERQKPLVLKISVKDGKQVFTSVDGASPKVNDSAVSSNNSTVTENFFKDSSDESSDVTSNKDKLKLNSKDSVRNKERKNSDSNSDKDKIKKTDRSERKSRNGERDRERDRDRDTKRTSESSSRSSSKHKESSLKHHSSGSSNSSSSKKSSSSLSSHKSSSSSKDRDSKSSSGSSKDRDRSSRDKLREREKEKSKRDHERDKDKRDKETLSDKDKEALAKMTMPSINKLPKIPKKVNKDDSESSSSSSTAKKPSISIEVRKDTENRPKTVKTFNSKFRSHGLGEEAPPPPSRKDLKRPTLPATTPVIAKETPSITSNTLKRSSPPPSSGTKEVLEKKLKIDGAIQEKPGGIKLISPKPSKLVESDMFMDALFAASTKKDLNRKRKRKSSVTGSKDEQGGKAIDKGKSSPERSDKDKEKDTPTEEKPVAPLKFYQDTLEQNEKESGKDEKSGEETGENAVNDGNTDDEFKSKKLKSNDDSDPIKTEEDRKETEENEEDIDEVKKPGPGCGPDGPPGVLVIHRRKGPKKKLTWRPQESLEEVRFFELDENERVNVTKNFVDMKQMERFSERDAFLLARKMSAEDTMVEQTEWKALVEVDDVPPHPNGSSSKERKIQQDRERTCLKALYFNRIMIPDSPAEPDMEQYKITDPQVIPFDDITGSSDAVNNFTNMPWPEPKGSPPHIKGNNFDQPNNQFQNFMPFNQYNSQPGSWGPMNGPSPGPGPGQGPQGNMQNNMPPMHNNNFGPNGPNMGPPDVMNMNNMNMPPMNQQFGPGPGNFGPGPGGPMGPNGPMGPMGPNGPMGPGGPPGGGFNNFGPPMDNMRMQGPRGGGNQGGWFRPNGPPNQMNNWRPPMDNSGGGGGGGGGGPGNHRPRWLNPSRICKSFQKGYCRKGDKCNFLHPGVNCPPF